MDMLRLLAILCSSLLVTAIDDNIVCPDGKSMCFDTETCCQMTSGSYGCCPLPNAVCCSDKVHCCPSGYTCNLATVSCDRNGHKIPALEQRTGKPLPSKAFLMKSPLKTPATNNVICPDGSSYCADGNTCCKTASGTYACCPLPSAVCCDDGVHCCPNGYTCGSGGFCLKGSDVSQMVKKTKAMSVAKDNQDICSHSQERCPHGETCCPLDGGEYGCCPMNNAVCCPDRQHCCPHGFRCNDLESRCTANGISIPYFTKVKTAERSKSLVSRKLRKIKDADTVFCPDHLSRCPANFTCCKNILGIWECCPLPKAECCADHKHCCPKGTECNLKSMSCDAMNSGLSVPWFLKVGSKKSPVNTVTCPDMTTCPTGYTCCLLTSGMYGCCPYPNAVCCSDNLHCCPQGTTCDVSHGACLVKVEIKLKKLTANNFVIDMQPNNLVVCQDHKSFCPSDSTCCQLPGGSFGCCPYKAAVCCIDRIHCCPHGMICDLKRGKCMKKRYVVLMKKKLPAKFLKASALVKCADETSCPSGYTCCKLSAGGYGCCPYEEAVCCSDGKHCCPHGTTCNLSAGTCDGGMSSLIMRKIKNSGEEAMVHCADGSSCPSGYTCCKLSAGGYGCCPYKEAVCCSDGKHCCPHGTTCNLSARTCDGGMSSLIVTKIKNNGEEAMVHCADGSSCPSGYTCCKLSGGGYGCCPYEKAVCCSDGKHCCPHGTTCNLSAGTCDGGMSSLIMTKIKNSGEEAMVHCADGSSCPSGYTCCKLSAGGYGCCPYEEAVCCSDGKHCCPHGTTCNLSAGTCDGVIGTSFTMREKLTLNGMRKENVICPDGLSSCPTDYTCCKMKSGDYGCCPLSDAVCCKDGEHCCPKGTSCDLSSETCISGKTVIKMKKKERALATNKGLVTCPDMLSSCPSGSSCCKLSNGDYGCCPFKKAVCCEDREHCCPRGTVCDSQLGHCVSEGHTSTLHQVLETLKANNMPFVLCPGGKQQCPGEYTCCLIGDKEYGCCPHQNAVCCSDKKHCCPRGFHCGAEGYCLKGPFRVKAKQHLVAKKNPKTVSDVSKDGDIVCPDKETVCLEGTSCCMNKDKKSFSCCPIQKAVCCPDHIHCCPAGWRCDTEQGTCRRGSDVFTSRPLMKKIPGKKLISNGRIGSQTDYNYIRFK